MLSSARHRLFMPTVENDGVREFPGQKPALGGWSRRLLQRSVSRVGRISPAARAGLSNVTQLLAQVSGPDDNLRGFSSLSLQELSTIKVTLVSKRQQRLSQVTAAVYVIQEGIRHTRMTAVADGLRLAPALSVARIDATWAVSPELLRVSQRIKGKRR
jgi:hypothetical protein